MRLSSPIRTKRIKGELRSVKRCHVASCRSDTSKKNLIKKIKDSSQLQLCFVKIKWTEPKNSDFFQSLLESPRSSSPSDHLPAHGVCVFWGEGTWEICRKHQINTDRGKDQVKHCKHGVTRITRSTTSDWMWKVLTASEPAVACPPPPSLKSWRHQRESENVWTFVHHLEMIVTWANQAAIQDVSHRWIKISWNESQLITGSRISDVTVQPSLQPRSFWYYRGVFSLFPSPFLRADPGLKTKSIYECEQLYMQRVLRGLGSFQAVNLKGFSGEWSWPTWRQMASAAYEHLEALRLSADTKNVALTVSIWGLWDVLVLSKSDICLADWMSGLWKRFLLLLTVFLILIKRVQKYWADVINNLCFHP